jgi:beta-lactam-binding protein with PASTA domain
VKLWRLLVFLIGAAALFGAGLLAFNSVVLPRVVHRNEVVLVPDLRGQTVGGAHSEASRVGLRLAETHRSAHPTVPPGLILSQTPAPSAQVRRGRVVKVVTSSGPPEGLVPQLTGLTRRQAEITLQRETFRLGRILHMRRPDVSVPTVVFQYPPAGLRQRKGQTVSLVVAEPTLPSDFLMPDLRGLSLFSAREKIAAAGFVSAPAAYRRDRSVPANTVLGQEPQPGVRIRKGERIELVAASR